MVLARRTDDSTVALRPRIPEIFRAIVARPSQNADLGCQSADGATVKRRAAKTDVASIDAETCGGNASGGPDRGSPGIERVAQRGLQGTEPRLIGQPLIDAVGG